MTAAPPPGCPAHASTGLLPWPPPPAPPTTGRSTAGCAPSGATSPASNWNRASPPGW
ncbi:hypothetical protein ACFQVA_34105 [Actinomadura keratinilytica]